MPSQKKLSISGTSGVVDSLKVSSGVVGTNYKIFLKVSLVYSAKDPRSISGKFKTCVWVKVGRSKDRAGQGAGQGAGQKAGQAYLGRSRGTVCKNFTSF